MATSAHANQLGKARHGTMPQAAASGLHIDAWFGVILCMCGVQGSALLPPKTAASREAVKELRNSLKSGIKSAWSHEALRRGIASAKVGDFCLAAILLVLRARCWMC